VSTGLDLGKQGCEGVGLEGLVAAYADAVWTEPAQDGSAKWVCASISLKAAP
jgi:hypothetical protein